MLPILTVADPDDARILFDLVNREFCKGDHDKETSLRLCSMMVALYAELTRTDDANRETTP
jgi:hypothetical protein